MRISYNLLKNREKRLTNAARYVIIRMIAFFTIYRLFAMLQTQLQLLPQSARPISSHCAMDCDADRVVIYNAGGVIMSYSQADDHGRRLAIGFLADQGLANAAELSAAFSVSVITVYRYLRKYREGGVGALSSERGPRGGYKLKGDRLAAAQRRLDEGASIRAAARAAGVSHMSVDYALRKGVLHRRERSAEAPASQPGERSRADAVCDSGIGVKRHPERQMARLGQLGQGETRFEPAHSVSGGGALIALPALAEQGLLSVGESVFGPLKNGYYGLCHVLLSLALMALLRIKNPEQLKMHAPGELGLLLGLDRAPEKKTLRRKLKELSKQGRAQRLRLALAEHWLRLDDVQLACLYVDGHVRPYHGRRHRLPKTHVARRRLCMDATTDFWVNDRQAQPWLVVTAEANDGLVSMLSKEILPDVRGQIGDRPATLVFDREGWSPDSFREWHEAGFDVMTYRKGRYQRWPEDEFVGVCDLRTRKEYWLAERRMEAGQKARFPMREVRRLRDGGHQTSIVTTRDDLLMLEVAVTMFDRWRQENFFRYMRHEFALDHLCAYAVEAADERRLRPNPELKALKDECARLRRRLTQAEAKFARTLRSGKKNRIVAAKEVRDRIHELETALAERSEQAKKLPERVAAGDVMPPDKVVRLEVERKLITDLVKTVAYRAESALLPQLELTPTSGMDEARAFLKATFSASVDLLPCERRKQLVVRFHSMAQPRFNRALRRLCDRATAKQTVYPGTDLIMIYQGPPVTSQY